MNKSELVSAIADKSGVTVKDTEAVVNALTEVVEGALIKGDKVQLTGFGTFEVSERAAREARNPKTGEKVKVAACKVPKFKAGKSLREAVNQ